jgi:hypothetical protein
MQGKKILGTWEKNETSRIQGESMAVGLQLMHALTHTLQPLLVRIDSMSVDRRYIRAHGLRLFYMCLVFQLESLHTAWGYHQ